MLMEECLPAPLELGEGAVLGWGENKVPSDYESSEFCNLSDNELRLMPNAVRDLHRNYNDSFQTLDYSSIGHGDAVFEEHDDDANMLADYFNSTFEETNNSLYFRVTYCHFTTT